MMILFSLTLFLIALSFLSMEMLIFSKSLSFMQNILFLNSSYSTYGGCDKMNSLFLTMLAYITMISVLAFNFMSSNMMFKF